MDTTVVTDWGDAVLVSVTDALRNFLGFLPQLIGAILVLVIGWIVAGLLATLVERGLKAVGFERAAQSTGIAGFVERAGSGWTVSQVVAEIVKWFIRLIAIQAAASILGMDQITQIINSILLWLPNLVVALAIVVIGALIARFVSGIVRGATAEMGFANPDLVADIARYAIIVFAVIAAIDQLGIAETVVQTLFVGAVAAIAAALALAFGLGGQQVASQLTQRWYTRAQEASQRVAAYATRMQTERQATPATAPATPSRGRTASAGSATASPAIATGPIVEPPSQRRATSRTRAVTTTEPILVREASTGLSGSWRDRLSWGPIWAGLLTAIALFLLLSTLALALGAQAVQGGDDPGGGAGLSALVSALAAVIAFFSGGYVASRAADTEDGGFGALNGFLVWAVGVAIIVALAALGLGSLFGASGDLFAQYRSLGSPQTGVAPETVAEGIRNAALGALAGLLLPGIAAMLGGWMGAGETRREDRRVVT